MLIEETLKPLISTLEAEKKKSDKDITEIQAGLLRIIQKIKAIQEELESQRKEATSALRQASKITHTTAHMIENHMDKAKLLNNIKDWAYPLMTAVLVSLLWTVSWKLWLPNYNDIITNQSQIWHKLEEMSSNELKVGKKK